MNQSHLFAKHTLNEELAGFVEDGLVDLDRRPKHGLGLLKGELAEQLVRDLRVAPTANKPIDRDTLAAESYVALVQFVKASRTLGNLQQAMLAVRGLSRTRQEELCEQEGVRLAEAAPAPADDPLFEAFQLAGHNRLRAQQRLAALYYLSSQAPRYSTNAQALGKQVEDASQHLRGRAAHFGATRMKFAVLLGGAALATVKSELMRDSFASNYSIMQYLEPDEHLPSSWQASEEETFREALKRCGEA